MQCGCPSRRKILSGTVTDSAPRFARKRTSGRFVTANPVIGPWTTQPASGTGVATPHPIPTRPMHSNAANTRLKCIMLPHCTITGRRDAIAMDCNHTRGRDAIMEGLMPFTVISWTPECRGAEARYSLRIVKDAARRLEIKTPKTPNPNPLNRHCIGILRHLAASSWV
jgi:hypothetical protein